MAGPQGVGTVASVLSVTQGTHKHTKWKGSVLSCVRVCVCVAAQKDSTQRIAAANKHTHTHTYVTHNSIVVWPGLEAATEVDRTEMTVHFKKMYNETKGLE